MSKVLFVATVVKTHIMEFHIPYLKMLKNNGWETAVAARNDYDNKNDCVIPYCDNFYDVDFDRSPLSIKNVFAYMSLKRIIDEGQYDVVHCHTPVGGVLTRIAARKARRSGTKVVYTAHGFHFYKGAPLFNWLIYFPVEYFCSFFTDTLITINQEDYKRAKKYFHANEIVYVPGVGIDLDKFKAASTQKVEMRQKLGLSQDDFVLLSVAELTKNKNHKVVLDAMAKIKNENRDVYEKLQYLIVGCGKENDNLNLQVENLGISSHVRFLGYRNDVNDLYHCSDLFVFMSMREGLSLALMEAMSSGMLIIASKIRGNVDLLTDSKTGRLIDIDINELSQAIVDIYSNRSNCNYGLAAKEAVKEFSLEHVLTIMKDLY